MATLCWSIHRYSSIEKYFFSIVHKLNWTVLNWKTKHNNKNLTNWTEVNWTEQTTTTTTLLAFAFNTAITSHHIPSYLVPYHTHIHTSDKVRVEWTKTSKTSVKPTKRICFSLPPMFSVFLVYQAIFCVFHRICLCVCSFFFCILSVRQRGRHERQLLPVFFCFFWLCVTFRKFMLFVFVCTYICFFLLPYMSRFVYSHWIKFYHPLLLYVYVCVFSFFCFLSYFIHWVGWLAGWLVWLVSCHGIFVVQYVRLSNCWSFKRCVSVVSIVESSHNVRLLEALYVSGTYWNYNLCMYAHVYVRMKVNTTMNASVWLCEVMLFLTETYGIDFMIISTRYAMLSFFKGEIF